MEGRDFNAKDETSVDRHREATHDDEIPVEHDGRAPTNTSFDASSGAVDGYGEPIRDQEKWQRLYRQQQGHRWDDNHERRRDADKRRLVRTVGSRCELSQSVIDDACALSDRLDYRFGANRPRRKVVLGIIMYIAPERYPIESNDAFRTFIEDWETSIEEIQDIYRIIKDRESIEDTE